MKTPDSANVQSLNLIHENKKVDFAFRTMEEIHERIGNTPDHPHRHDYYTILWANKACGQHFIDYKEHVIQPNYIFFVNPGQVHQVITYGYPSGYVIMFTAEFLHRNAIREEFLTNLGLFSDSAETPPLLVPKESSSRLHEFVINIEDVCHSENPFKMETLSAWLKLFLIECNRVLPVPGDNNPQKLQSSQVILKNFKKLVETNFSDWHKVGNYADRLALSADYLNNVIKSSIGKTAKEFIQHRISLEAKRLGVHTQLTSKEIAYRLGFEDPSHFSKFFKNIEGKSFSDFRISLENFTQIQ